MPYKKRLLKERIIDDSSKTKSQLFFEWIDDRKERRKRGDFSRDTSHNMMLAATCRDELEKAEDAYELIPNESTRSAFLIAKSNYRKAEKLHRRAVACHKETFDRIKAAKH